VHSKKGVSSKNDDSLGMMTVGQIQDLIANAVKAELRGHASKTQLYTKPYTKRVDAFYMPCSYQSPKF